MATRKPVFKSSETALTEGQSEQTLLTPVTAGFMDHGETNEELMELVRSAVRQYAEHGFDDCLKVGEALDALRKESRREDSAYFQLFSKNRDKWDKLRTGLGYSNATGYLRIFDNQAMRQPEIREKLPHSFRTLVAISSVAVLPSEINLDKEAQRRKLARWEQLEAVLNPKITRDDVRPPKRKTAVTDEASERDTSILGLYVPRNQREAAKRALIRVGFDLIRGQGTANVYLLDMQATRETNPDKPGHQITARTIKNGGILDALAIFSEALAHADVHFDTPRSTLAAQNDAPVQVVAAPELIDDVREEK